jgi:molybdenum cofactor cytidylyltransferase
VRVAAVILAAGSSRRLGSPKQLIRLQGETLLERAVRVACEAGCQPVIVVLGSSAELIRESCPLRETVIVVNERWNEGMGTSISAGVAGLQDDIDGCIVMTCDMPAVSAEHLGDLMRSGEITASRYAERRGVPAYFPKDRFLLLAELQGDTGARTFLKDVRTVELSGGELDVDTIEDMTRALELFD